MMTCSHHHDHCVHTGKYYLGLTFFFCGFSDVVYSSCEHVDFFSLAYTINAGFTIVAENLLFMPQKKEISLLLPDILG